MDTQPEALASAVRAKRVAVENGLEVLRVRIQRVDPRRVDPRRWAKLGGTVVPVSVGLCAAWWLLRGRRSVRSLDQLLQRQLADLYTSEQRLVTALARMSETASNPDVARAFDQHRLETIGHVDRLDRVFRSIGRSPRRGSSQAITGIVTESEKLLSRRMNPDVRDAWLIASAQRVEHIEIANYGTARTFADTLGYVRAAGLLQQTLEEERAADERLTHLAVRFVNPQSVRG